MPGPWKVGSAFGSLTTCRFSSCKKMAIVYVRSRGGAPQGAGAQTRCVTPYGQAVASRWLSPTTDFCLWVQRRLTNNKCTA